MSFSDLTIEGFTEALAARTPVPGGGGASALVCALGAALGCMVGNYTVGKKNYAAAEPEVRELMAEAERIRAEAAALVEADAEAFEPLSRAYAIPADDPQRAEIMEQSLRTAAAVPMQILRLSCRMIELHKRLGEIGSTLMASDVGTGVVFCWSAMYGAVLNVRVNTKLMADREYAGALEREADELMQKYWKIADEVYESVYGRYC